jgi:hypothetical protein
MEAFAKALAPYAGPPGELHASALVTISGARRATQAPRATNFGGTTTRAVSQAVETIDLVPPRKKSPVLAIVAVAAVLAIGGGGTAFWLSRQGSSEGDKKVSAQTAQPAETEPKKKDPESATPATAAKVEVKVRITPAEAQVTVDGKPAKSFADGVLSLEGEAGDTFDVVATVGDRKQVKQVMIRKDGKGSIDAIEVPAASQKPLAAGVTVKGKPTVTAGAIAPTNNVGAPATTPVATTPPPPTATAVGQSTF